MKKIISALTVSALALGSIFAADVSLEFTQKAYLYNPNGGKLQYTGYGDNSGEVAFTAKTDTAGVTFGFDPTNYETKAGNKGDITLDEYTGWVNFGEGAFKLQSGVWTSRSVNRFNDNAGDWEDNEYERYHLGIMNGSWGSDINNLSGVNGDNHLSTALTFKNDSFYVSGILLGLDEKGGTNADYGTLDFKSGFGIEAGLAINEGTKLTVDFKTPKNKVIAIGAFVENTTLKENLDFVAGFTLAQSDSDGSFEGAIDFRGEYALGDNTTLTTMNNLTTTGSGNYALWDMVSFAVQTSDTIQVLFTVEWEHTDLLNKTGTPGNAQGTLDLIPSVKYSPIDGVDLSAGLIINTTGWSEPSSAKVAIPFLLHVAI